jgi:2-oxoisovalerate dehydrogenase E1 component beta subunit
MSMAEMSLIEAIRDALLEEMARDERVIVLGEDVGLHGGVFRATDGLQEKFGAGRVIDTPLAELMIAGVAIGAAANGLRPVAEMQFADFGHPAFDQIVSDAARWRYRTAGAQGLPLVIRMPYGAGIHGALYHSQSVEAFYAHVPGLRVVAPSTPHDAKGMLVAAIRDPDPVIFLEHKKAYRLVRGEVPEGDYTVPLDRARIARSGRDMSVFAYGLMLHHCHGRGGGRPAFPGPSRPGGDPGLGAQDGQGARRLRGQQDPGPRRRGGGADRRGGI